MRHKIRLAAALAVVLAVTTVIAPLRRTSAADQLGMTAVEHGKKLYETIGGVGCIACHGSYGEGKLGPTNRGVNEATVREALSKIGAMQFLHEQLTEDDIKQLAAYTEWMGRHMLIKTLLKRGRFIPETVSVYPGTPVQLVVENTAAEPSTLSGEGVAAAPQTIPGRETGSIVWTAPEAEGKLTLACSNCKTKDGLLTIEVTKAARPYVPPSQPKVIAKP
jgi:mono/diheme cytochrome c family protein